MSLSSCRFLVGLMIMAKVWVSNLTIPLAANQKGFCQTSLYLGYPLPEF
jgi:hypothetical protein